MDDSADQYQSIDSSARLEIPKIKGSRFIAIAIPVTSRQEAKNEIQSIKEEFRDASHHCYAFRVQKDDLIFQSSDDGEPTATAGIPILKQLESRNLRNVLVVVVRYFGGSKLGKGGLIRAYGSAARALVSELDLKTREIKSRIQIEFPYSDTSIVRRVLSQRKAEVTNESYGAKTVLEIALARASERSFILDLDNALSGQLRWKKLGEGFK